MILETLVIVVAILTCLWCIRQGVYQMQFITFAFVLVFAFGAQIV